MIDDSHPDPLIAREVRIDELEGLLAEAHAGLLRALDYRTATPEGLAIKGDVRDALRRTGFKGNFGTSSAPRPTGRRRSEVRGGQGSGTKTTFGGGDAYDG